MNRQTYTIVFYNLSMLKSLIDLLNKKNESGLKQYQNYQYAYCLHDKDIDRNGNIKKAHYHLMLKFPIKFKCDDLFNVIKDYLPNQNIFEIRGANKNGWAYLIHANALEKYQYCFDDIVSNIDKDDLFEMVESGRKITPAMKNFKMVSVLIDILNHNAQISTYNQLVRYLINIGDEDLLYWCMNKSYQVSMILSSRKKFNN